MNCNTSGKCEDEILQSLIKSDRLYCMESCQNNTLCRFSSYSEAKNLCLLLVTCYKLNKNESSFSSSKVSCDLPPGGTFFCIYITFGLTKFLFELQGASFVFGRNLKQKISTPVKNSCKFL